MSFNILIIGQSGRLQYGSINWPVYANLRQILTAKSSSQSRNIQSDGIATPQSLILKFVR